MRELNEINATEQSANNISVLNHKEYLAAGNTVAKLRVRNQINFSTGVRFPVFISGELEADKYSVARQIHHRRCLQKEAFIGVSSNISDLAHYKNHLDKCIQEAQGGTLYLPEVDLLPDIIKEHLITLFNDDNFNNRIYKNEINLIVSCTYPVTSNNDQSEYIANLLNCTIPYLEIHIALLRQKKEAFNAYINYISQGVATRHYLSLDSVAMDLLLSYDWPQQLDQLQKILCLLAYYCESDVTQEDVLALNFTNDKATLDIIDVIERQDMEPFKYAHIGLQKALMYLAENYKQEITLTALSNVACTSSSHLSYLFRRHLNLSFKTILVQLRIRYAKRLIEDVPRMKITDISLESGFGDLSHFEKMFKRYIGYTPRQHRQKLRVNENVYP